MHVNGKNIKPVNYCCRVYYYYSHVHRQTLFIINTKIYLLALLHLSFVYVYFLQTRLLRDFYYHLILNKICGRAVFLVLGVLVSTTRRRNTCWGSERVGHTNDFQTGF